MKQGSIYVLDLSPVTGNEQDGNRPVLVVSNNEYNKVSRNALIVPITHGGGFADRIGYALPLPAGLNTTGFILCHQSRTVDLKARRGRFVETIPSDVLEEAIERILSIF